MKSCSILLFFICVNFGYNGVCSLNILGIFPYQGKSHFFVFEPYLKELARRGHNLTVISYFPQKNPIENYFDISLAGKVKILEGVFPINRSYRTLIQIINFLTQTGRDNCEILLSHEKVQNLWKSEAKFDLVVTEMFNSDCSLGLAYKIGAPVVGVTSHVPMPWHYDRYGIQYHPSFMRLQFVEDGTKPTLYQRLERFILHKYITILYKYTCQNVNQKQLQQYFDVPPLEELARGVKFTLLYTNFVITGPELYPPNVIEVGGYHVTEPKELPTDLKKFIDESEHGIIYISFGSMLQAATTPKDNLDAIIAALSEIPQRVVWKWDENTLPGNPKNIYLSKWLPQNDILAHPKVVAFFSHCGMLSTTEAINYGVPMIGMPVFGDQPGNAGAIEESGLGVQIHVKDLTKENLLQKFNTVLDPQFRQKVKELSRIWHDRPLSPMDTAIYWTEFAARTKNYTFVSPAATVPLYQYLYLDIILVAASFLFVIYQTTKALISLLRNKMQRSPSKLKTK